jgi:pimeloyl-ACP methyl ester carboxylesterase
MPLIEDRSRPSSMAVAGRCTTSPIAAVPAIGGTGRSGWRSAADAPRRLPDGTWELLFQPQDALEAERLNEGDHWADWLASSCPVLLVHGTRSQLVAPERAREMGERRPRTTVVALDADHFVHAEAPDAFAAVVRGFLDGIATRAVTPAER